VRNSYQYILQSLTDSLGWRVQVLTINNIIHMTHANYYIGLMSGSSLDGIDTVLVDLADNKKPAVLATTQAAIPTDIRTTLLDAYQTPIDLAQAAQLDSQLGELFAKSVLRLLTQCRLSAHDIRAIGSHGQTIYHVPNERYPYSIQLGSPSVIAALTQITTVAHFRELDLAYGGQGAPLAPLFHQHVFANPDETRVVVNIGGMANITWLSPREPIRGFDTGPGNVLSDLWYQQHQQGPYDIDGMWGSSGNIHPRLLKQLLATAYFQQPPPKSTGREQFNLPWLHRHLTTLNANVSAADVQTTLVELTAYSIAQGIDGLPTAPTSVIVCGGGAYNHYLMQRLQHHLAPATLISSERHGILPDWVEAAAFAWFAHQTLARAPQDLTHITGSSQPHILGGIYHP
jgi:anhydro-N-acetylmuramic acid kinase